MADAAKILARVRELGANVTIDGGKLVIINREKLPTAAMDVIRTHGKDIAAFLSNEAEFEEHAAIMEFDGGLTRSGAEYITRILMRTPPAGTERIDWQWFVNEAAKVVERDLGRAA